MRCTASSTRRHAPRRSPGPAPSASWIREEPVHHTADLSMSWRSHPMEDSISQYVTVLKPERHRRHIANGGRRGRYGRSMRPRSRHRGWPVRGPWPPVSSSVLWALSAAGALATAGAVAITLDSAPSEHKATAALLHGLIVAVPVALGCAALTRRRD